MNNWKEELKTIAENSYCPDCGTGSETGVEEFVTEIIEKLIEEIPEDVNAYYPYNDLDEMQFDSFGVKQQLKAKWLPTEKPSSI